MLSSRFVFSCQLSALATADDLFIFTDRYLKKHSFCDECTKMVNKAYALLVEDEEPDQPVSKGSSGCQDSGCSASHPPMGNNLEDEKKISKIYNGLTSCVSDQHVHVECKEEVVAHLIEMAEPELSGFKQERHAKTIEIAQKEVLTCIGKSERRI